MLISLPFLVSSLVVIMTPGPDLVLVTHLVLRHERRRPAITAAVGMISAGVLQAALGLAGLTALLHANATLFTAFRWAGAAVMFWWGLLAWLSALRPARTPDPTAPDISLGQAYLRGFVSTGSNPKVGVFLMAFLPQFVPPGAPVVPAFAVLAAVYLAMGFLWLLICTNLVHRIRGVMLAAPVRRVADALIGAVFIVFAIRLLLAG